MGKVMKVGHEGSGRLRVTELFVGYLSISSLLGFCSC